MSEPAPEPPRVPLGKPLEWTDADLDALAEVSPQDVLEAQAWVNTHASETGKALWEARPAEEEQG